MHGVQTQWVFFCSARASGTSHFYSRFFFSFNVLARVDISKFVVDFNLIMMSNPKYIVILTGLFGSIVASGTSHFDSLFFFFFVFFCFLCSCHKMA